MMVILGTEYYRPPNPDVTNWEEDIRKIRETGLSLIRTWIQWQQVNPVEGIWDFSMYDHLFEIARKNDIKVLIQLNIEVPPEWLIKKYPQAYWIKANGQPVIPSSVGMAQVGTYPGLTPDFYEVRKAAEEFLCKTTEHYKNYPALFGYDIWNEIMPFYGFKSIYLYHPQTQKKFREWLKKRYKTIEKFDSLYLRNYKSFSDVSMPEKGVYLEMLDLHEFATNWIADYMNWKIKIVRSYDTKHPIVSHAAGALEALLTQPFDVWELTKSLDIWGTSCYETDFWKTAFQCVVTRDSSQGKPWGIVEMSGGHTWGLYGDKVRSPQFLEQLPLLALSYGGKFNMFWQWRPERFGQESPNFGLTDEDGSFNERTHRVAQLAQAIQKNEKLFNELKFPANDVGLLIDWRSFSLEESSLGEAGKFTISEYLGWFRALSELGVNVEVLYGSQVVKNGIPKSIKLLIAPLLNIERPGIMSILENFISQDGHFIAGPYLFTYDSFTYMHSQTPPLPMQRVFGSGRINLLYPSEVYLEVIGARPRIKITGYHCLEVYNCQEAHPWLCSGKLIVGTKNILKNSVCYRIGSLVGSAYLKNNQLKFNNLLELLKDVLSVANCSYQPASTSEVLVRLGKTDQNYLLFVHNTKDFFQTSYVKLEIPLREAKDLVSNEKINSSKGKEICLYLQPRESKVIYIKS